MSNFKVEITSNKTDMTWRGFFETLEDAEAWRDAQIGKPFRLPQREKRTSFCTAEELAEAIDTIPAETTTEEYYEILEEAVYDDSGNLVSEAVFAETPSTREIELVPEKKVLPAQFTATITDNSTENALREAAQAKIQQGRKIRNLCADVLDLVTGWNDDRALTEQQVSDFQSTFSGILVLLQANRPFTAKGAIDGITPDGVLVTQEMLDQIEFLYQESGLV